MKWVGNRLVSTGHPRMLIVLTSHHALRQMNNATPDENAGPCMATGPGGCDRVPFRGAVDGVAGHLLSLMGLEALP